MLADTKAEYGSDRAAVTCPAMQADVAIVGGTGVGPRLATWPGRALAVPTPQGLLRGRVSEIQGVKVFAVQRHSAGHKTPPHLVNYRALAIGLKRLGVRACLATAAVGSLRPEFGPGTMLACHDFIDLTARRQTLFNRVVVHRDFSEPFSAPLRGHLVSAGQGEVHDGGIYVCGDGPRYETPHEIELMRQWGGDVVGMTAATEAILLREAEVPYACLAVVTNLAAGLQAELSHEEVVDAMEARGDRIVEILLRAARLSLGQ